MNSLLILLGNMCGVASTEGAEQGSSTRSIISTIVMFALIILIFYFLIFRPQRKRDKEAKAMIAAMKRGDKVVTIGGIHGTIVTVKDKTVVVKVDDTTRLEFSKDAISSVLNKDNVVAAPQQKDKKKDKKSEENNVVEEKKVEETQKSESVEEDKLSETKVEAESSETKTETESSEEANDNIKPFKAEETKEDK